jgi:hypothetical protein
MLRKTLCTREGVLDFYLYNAHLNLFLQRPARFSFKGNSISTYINRIYLDDSVPRQKVCSREQNPLHKEFGERKSRAALALNAPGLL